MNINEFDFDVDRNVLSEQVAQKLEKMITSDATQVSQKLPSEQTLAAGFGVSRPVVREALAILRERGLVAQRQGGGCYITSPDSSQVSQCVGRFASMGQISHEDVYVARISLETSIVRLAAENCTPEDIQKLQCINVKMSDKAIDVPSRVELDIHFHKKIAEIAQNRLLMAFEDALSNFVSYMITAALKLPGADNDGIRYHERIIEALQDHDANQAEEIMREHLTLSMRNWEIGKEEQ